MTDAEFKKYVDSMPDDLAGFNDALERMSDAQRAEFEARAAALAKNQSGPDDYDSAWGAFGKELGYQALNEAADRTPVLGQLKALYELSTGRDLMGNEIGKLGRAAATANFFTFGNGKKATDALGAAQAGLGKLFDKVDEAADAASDATKAAKGVNVVTPIPPVTKIGQLETGKTVLGSYPGYIKLADELNAKRFNIPPEVWKKMSAAEQWAANQKFLDRMIARGDEIILSNSALKTPLSPTFAKEIEYLISKGFRISDDGFRMLPPGL